MTKIDVVVTWVDGTDPVWLEEKKKYVQNDSFTDADIDVRYRPSELFKYWFRGIETYAPWVNKVFFITYGHVPEWLNTEHPKLRIVKHEEYIPKEYLPTYNSNVIELNLHRIEELNEQFIVFNDDMYLINPVSEEDFFVNGKVKDYPIYKPIVPLESYNHIELNNTIVMNKYFSKKEYMKNNIFKFINYKYGKYNMHNVVALIYSEILGYKNFHISLSHLKSTFKEVWDIEEQLLSKVSMNKFRSNADVNHFLMSHWNIETGRFVAQKINFGRYFPSDQIHLIKEALEKDNYKVICINDEDNGVDYSDVSKELESLFHQKLPYKSSFEKI